MTSLANMDMPKGRGKKANNASQKRKGPANAPKKPIVETYCTCQVRIRQLASTIFNQQKVLPVTLQLLINN